ncbi:MAG: DUF6206 family protein [Ilumatobacteraceae bacterium]
MNDRQSAADIDLHEVESAVAAAIKDRNNDSLRLLGHGEISIVIAWPTAQPQVALKRVPPFRDASAAQRYAEVCEQFFGTLTAAGVGVWPTTLHPLQRSDGKTVVYHRQPIADMSQLGSNVLRAAAPADGHPLIDAIVDAAARVCTPTTGFDCQMANWLWDGTTATQIDFTSPFVLTDDRKELVYDSNAFLQEYPWALRAYLKKELTGLMHRFTTVEGALGDMVANMLKEGLDQWVDPAIASINDRLGVEMRRETAEKMLADDAKLLPLTLKLKKGQRWWLARTGRRYEALLPERTTYGK